MDEVSLLIVASGINVIQGVTILYSMYLGDCTLNAFWIVFAVMMIIIGLYIPLQHLFHKSYTNFNLAYNALCLTDDFL